MNGNFIHAWVGFFTRQVRHLVNRTYWLEGRNSGFEEVHPEENLSELSGVRLGQAERDQVDGVGIPDEVIIQHEVRFIPGEIPDTHISRTYNETFKMTNQG